jgi:hypothetical protein
VSTLIHAIVYVFLHNLLNVLVQIANKMGLQKKKTHICTPLTHICMPVIQLFAFQIIEHRSIKLHTTDRQ